MTKKLGPISEEIFAEEYCAFVRMGMSDQEIARSFRMSLDTLSHRVVRYDLSSVKGGSI